MKDDFDTMGLVRHGHWLLWGYQAGRLRWAPHWLRKGIVVAWNHIACRIWGHETFGPIYEDDIPGMRVKAKPKTCMHCSKVFPEEVE